MIAHGYYAEATAKHGRVLATLGPYETRAEAEAAAVAAWPQRERATISRNRYFDLRWINPRQLAAAKA